MNILLPFNSCTGATRDNIICNANNDAVSLLDGPSVGPRKGLSTQSIVDDNLANKIECTGFVDESNPMTNVFSYQCHITGDTMVTVVHTLISGIEYTDCDVYFPPNANGGTAQQVIISIPWSYRFLDAQTVFWTPTKIGSGYEYQPEA